MCGMNTVRANGANGPGSRSGLSRDGPRLLLYALVSARAGGAHWLRVPGDGASKYTCIAAMTRQLSGVDTQSNNACASDRSKSHQHPWEEILGRFSLALEQPTSGQLLPRCDRVSGSTSN